MNSAPAPAAIRTTDENRNQRRWLWAGVLLWLIPLLVIGAMVVHDPLKRTVTPVYHKASTNWWAGEELYRDSLGYNYLPHFAIGFSPFQMLPVPIGDLVWRLGSVALLVFGIWRCATDLFGQKAPRAFFLACALALLLCLGAVRNGQANVIFGALMFNAAICLPRQQWWAAIALMFLAIIVKPLGIVLLFLAAAIYPALRWRAFVALLIFLVFPFLFGKYDYVLEQHRAFMKNLQVCAVVTQHRFADINGIVRTFGGEIPGGISKMLRVIAGGLTLALCYCGARRVSDPLRAFWIYTLAAGYLMLFNPMTEANSYVIFAPVLALWAVYFLNATQTRALGWLIVGMIGSMGILPTLVRPLCGNYFSLFWHPLMAAIFLALVIREFWRKENTPLLVR